MDLIDTIFRPLLAWVELGAERQSDADENRLLGLSEGQVAREVRRSFGRWFNVYRMGREGTEMSRRRYDDDFEAVSVVLLIIRIRVEWSQQEGRDTTMCEGAAAEAKDRVRKDVSTSCLDPERKKLHTTTDASKERESRKTPGSGGLGKDYGVLVLRRRAL